MVGGRIAQPNGKECYRIAPSSRIRLASYGAIAAGQAPRPHSPFAPHDDLRIGVIAEEISPYRDYTRAIRDILCTLLTDIETLAYRHEVLDDCLNQPDFTAGT